MPARQNKSENYWLLELSDSQNEYKLEVLAVPNIMASLCESKWNIVSCAKHQGQPM